MYPKQTKKITTEISAFRTHLIFRCFELFYIAPDDLRCDLGTMNCASATLFRHTAADSVVGFDIFMYGNCVSNQRIGPWRETLRRHGLHCLIRFFKYLRDTG